LYAAKIVHRVFSFLIKWVSSQLSAVYNPSQTWINLQLLRWKSFELLIKGCPENLPMVKQNGLFTSIF